MLRNKSFLEDLSLFEEPSDEEISTVFGGNVLRWVRFYGVVPFGAVVAGRERNYLNYVCRVSLDDGQRIAGKFPDLPDRRCYYGLDGDEHSAQGFNFEVLTHTPT